MSGVGKRRGGGGGVMEKEFFEEKSFIELLGQWVETWKLSVLTFGNQKVCGIFLRTICDAFTV